MKHFNFLVNRFLNIVQFTGSVILNTTALRYVYLCSNVQFCCVTYSGPAVWIKFSAPEVEQCKLSVCGFWW